MAQNIFTEQLAEGVITSLNQRSDANLMNNPEKVNEFILYKNGKMPWVKLQSSVNHYGDVADGTAIAQRYVLRSLFTKKHASFIEYQERNQLEAYNYTSDFGYRPLPGINSITVSTLQPLGSLRQAVISYQCWTKGQLENLERLYMRPGFSCLLEWGWSYYLDDNNDLKTLTDGVNYFDASQSEQQIIDKMTSLKKKTNYHYDGMIGFVKNFSWKLRSDGGYDCTTTLISKGELISSMMVNVSSYALDTKTSPMSKFSFKSGASGNNYGMFKFRTLTNTSGYEGKDEDEVLEESSKPNTEEDGDSSKETYASMLNYQYARSILSGIFYELAAFSDIDDNRTGIYYQKFAASNSDFPTDSPIPVLSMKLKNDYGIEISRKEGSVGNYKFGSTDEKKFIYLKDFLRIVNNYGIVHYKGVKSNNSRGIFRINVGNIVCKYHPLVLSSNYDVCFVKPSTLIFDKIGSLASEKTVDGEVQEKINMFSNYLNKDFGPGQDYKIFDYRTDDSHANASHILLNLHYLYSKINDELLKSESDSNKNRGINLSSFMSSILSDVSIKLGGLSDLSMIFDDTNGICKIVDRNLLVEIDKAKKKELDGFKIPIFGEKSIVKNVSVESRIFAEQATMISIAAQLGGGTQYGLDSTVMGIYNDGLTDRFFTVKDHKINLKDKIKAIEDKEKEKNIEFEKMTEAGAKYIDYFLKNLPGASIVGENPGVVLDDSYLNNLLRFVESRNQSNQSAKNSRILPLNLNLTFDGISGFLIGNILNLDNNVIPEPFANSIHTYNGKTGIEDKFGLYKKYVRDIDYYFAVTGIDHSVNTSGWTTGIKTNYVLYNKDDSRIKVGKQYSTKNQVDQVFKGDIVILGFGATTLEEILDKNLNPGKNLKPEDKISDSKIKARILYFAELFRDLSLLDVQSKRKFSKWDIINIIGNSLTETTDLDPLKEQKAFKVTSGGKSVWSGAGWGLIQFDINPLRQPLFGSNGMGKNWDIQNIITNEADGHDVFDWGITDTGYLKQRDKLYTNTNFSTAISVINNFNNLTVYNRGKENFELVNGKFQVKSTAKGKVEFQCPSEPEFLKIVGASNKVYEKYKYIMLDDLGFDDQKLRYFTSSIEYLYMLWAVEKNIYALKKTNIFSKSLPDDKLDFKNSQKDISFTFTGTIGSGVVINEDIRAKNCDKVRDLIKNSKQLDDGDLKFGTL